MWGYYAQRRHNPRQRYPKSRRFCGCSCCLVYFFCAIFVILLAYIAYSPGRQLQSPQGDEVKPGRSKMELQAGAIAGIAMTVLFFFVLIIMIISCCFCWMRHKQQVELRSHSSLPRNTFGGMPRSEYARRHTAGHGFHPGIWTSANKYKVNQQGGGASFHVNQPGPQYYANSDPRFRHSRSQSFPNGYQPGGRGPTVFVYHSDAGKPREFDAPRFYHHREAEEIIEDEEKRTPGMGSPGTPPESPTSNNTTNEPIVEFPDDDDDDEEEAQEREEES